MKPVDIGLRDLVAFMPQVLFEELLHITQLISHLTVNTSQLNRAHEVYRLFSVNDKESKLVEVLEKISPGLLQFQSKDTLLEAYKELSTTLKNYSESDLRAASKYYQLENYIETNCPASLLPYKIAELAVALDKDDELLAYLSI